jgi:tetratricopeptide (TPR) repeat protein
VLISSRVQAGGQAREAVLLDDGAGEPSPDAKVLYVDEEERIWVPVEVTILGESFTEAWRKGGKEMRERQFAIIDVNKAWSRYAPLRLPEEAAEVAVPTRREVWRLFEKDLKLQQINLVSRDVSNFLSRLEKDPDDMQALNGLAVLLAKSGFLKQAAARFQRVVDEDPSPSSPEVHVELALTYCEIGEFIPARAHYELAMKLAPGLKSGEVTRFGESAEEMSSVSGE